MAQDRSDVSPRHQVQGTGDQLRVGQGPFMTYGICALVYGPDPFCRVGFADRHVEPHQRDPVSSHRVGLRPQASGHRQV